MSRRPQDWQGNPPFELGAVGDPYEPPMPLPEPEEQAEPTVEESNAAKVDAKLVNFLTVVFAGGFGLICTFLFLWLVVRIAGAIIGG